MMLYFLWRITHFFCRRLFILDNKLNACVQSKQLRTAREKLTVMLSAEECCRKERGSRLQKSLICHAGGGLNGRAYLNSIATFEKYYNFGCRCFEYDIVQDLKGHFWLSHSSNGVLNSFHDTASLQKCIELVCSYPDCIFIFDTKDVNLGAFIEAWNDSYQQLHHQIYIQVKNEDEIQTVLAKDNNANLLLVNCRNSNFVDNCALCSKYGISAVSIPHDCIKTRMDWRIFYENEIDVYAYTVNSIEEYCQLMKQNVSGVFSDFLTEELLNRSITTSEYNSD